MKTIKITYTSSAGYEVDLKAAPMRIKAANFHNYAWTRETVSLQYGDRLVAFGRKPQTYQTTLYIDTSDAAPGIIDRLHAEWERDIFLRTPGRLTWNGQYIECYVTSSSTYPVAGNGYVANEVEIYCPSPFWIHETEFGFEPQEGANRYLGYPYGYTYDFGHQFGTSPVLWGEESGMMAFKAAITGPAVSPTFTVAGRTYGIDLTLSEGEMVVIDTRPTAPMGEQVYRISGGTKINLFEYRIGDIEPVAVDYYGILTWSGEFPIDLTIYMGRSEPGWL